MVEMTSKALHHACLSVALLCSGSSLATPTPVQLVLEGSSEGQELLLSVSVQTSSSVAAPQPTPIQADTPPIPVLGQVSGFVQENLLLVLVASGLLLVVALLACAAVAMGRRRKATAYHPAGFPPQMYVDRRDKTGGDAMPFSEVPEKPPRRLAAQDNEPADSRTQLQSDIARATRSLRSPGKPPSEGGGRGRDPAKSADCVLQDGPPEGDALRTRLESEAVTLADGAERLPEEAKAQQDVDPDSEEPPSGPGPSQQQLSGSNIVQSVSGQITAF